MTPGALLHVRVRNLESFQKNDIKQWRTKENTKTKDPPKPDVEAQGTDTPLVGDMSTLLVADESALGYAGMLCFSVP